MAVTRGQIKANLQANLFELGFNFYSDNDMNDSIQDAYDDIAILTQCIQKQITVKWIAQLSYYDFMEDTRLGISDYLGTIAVFNNVTNQWLRDDLSLKDFDRIRRDWENWIGTPLFWAPSDPKRIAIAAKYTGPAPIPQPPIIPPPITVKGSFTSSAFSPAFWIDQIYQPPPIPQPPIIPDIGSFILYYWALAPLLTSDNDTFLIANDKTSMLTFYATADLLEQAQEYGKAQGFWQLYLENLDDYSDRVKRNCKSDLLLRL